MMVSTYCIGSDLNRPIGWKFAVWSESPILGEFQLRIWDVDPTELFVLFLTHYTHRLIINTRFIGSTRRVQIPHSIYRIHSQFQREILAIIHVLTGEI